MNENKYLAEIYNEMLKKEEYRLEIIKEAFASATKNYREELEIYDETTDEEIENSTFMKALNGVLKFEIGFIDHLKTEVKRYEELCNEERQG